MTDIPALNDNVRARLTCPRARRVFGDENAVLVIFSRRLTDDELSFFLEVCQRSAPLMEG